MKPPPELSAMNSTCPPAAMCFRVASITGCGFGGGIPIIIICWFGAAGGNTIHTTPLPKAGGLGSCGGWSGPVGGPGGAHSSTSKLFSRSMSAVRLYCPCPVVSCCGAALTNTTFTLSGWIIAISAELIACSPVNVGDWSFEPGAGGPANNSCSLTIFALVGPNISTVLGPRALSTVSTFNAGSFSSRARYALIFSSCALNRGAAVTK